MEKKKTIRPWTSKEIEYIKSKYPIYPTKQLAIDLKRSTHCIAQKANSMGIKKDFDAANETRESEHLCWKCKYSTNSYLGFCSWAHNLKPVEGWITVSKFNGFSIVKCPLFEEENKVD